MVFFYVVAVMDYFVSAFLKLAEQDPNYFDDNVSPSTPEQHQRQQDKIICPALAMPDSPRATEDEGTSQSTCFLVSVSPS